jgi:predicted lysophospholipase L1 biosynthesis ABC-type transport system permease subunit
MTIPREPVGIILPFWRLVKYIFLATLIGIFIGWIMGSTSVLFNWHTPLINWAFGTIQANPIPFGFASAFLVIVAFVTHKRSNRAKRMQKQLRQQFEQQQSK